MDQALPSILSTPETQKAHQTTVTSPLSLGNHKNFLVGFPVKRFEKVQLAQDSLGGFAKYPVGFQLTDSRLLFFLKTAYLAQQILPPTEAKNRKHFPKQDKDSGHRDIATAVFQTWVKREDHCVLSYSRFVSKTANLFTSVFYWIQPQRIVIDVLRSLCVFSN